ncbi:hypothetical protein CR513_36071, partial [Mucuna pruriens]
MFVRYLLRAYATATSNYLQYCPGRFQLAPNIAWSILMQEKIYLTRITKHTSNENICIHWLVKIPHNGKEAQRKWRMCTNYTDLNKACPKDSYPLLIIDTLVDGASGCGLLSLTDTYLVLGTVMRIGYRYRLL